ncbi:MAG: aldose 1-epimerase [Armatimonadetes bacterium]|nr:aldose 1-epimerase [Armatimonadota bacterium]
MPHPYSVRSERRDGMEVVSLRQDEAACAEVAPGFGNNCFAFRLARPVLEPVPFETFRRRPTGYGIPILFPFPDRIREGVFHFRGRRYEVSPDRHGYARHKPWEAVGSGASEERGAWVQARLEAARHPEDILSQFPHPFRLTVTHRLKDSALAVEIAVENTGPEDLPFGLGLHPYFALPVSGTIRVPARKRWEMEDHLPTGRLLDVAPDYDLRAPRSARGLVLDDIYTDLAADADGLTRCWLADTGTGVKTVLESGGLFRHIVVCTPPAPRPSLCIEPLTCPADAFNLHDRGIESGLIILPPGRVIHGRVRIYQENA